MKSRGDNRCDSALFSICCAMFASLWIFSSYSNAADWTIIPRSTISETYIDNVALGGGIGGGGGGGGFGGSGNQGGDFITQMNPGISLTGVGRRLNVNTNYTMNNIIFAKNSNRSRTRHQLAANATTELIEDLFFLDGSARIFQQNASLLGPQATDNANLSANRINMKIYTVSPYLRHRFKNFASTESRYTRSIVESGGGSGAPRNSQRDSYQSNLNSGDYFRTLQWGLHFNHNKIHIDGNSARSGRTIELERSIANLRYNLNSRFALTATGGYEKNSFIRIRGKTSSPTWTVGFIWAPSPRTDINLAAGQRFYGNTYNGEVNHRTRLTTWTARYVESVTTFNQQAGQVGGFDSFGGNFSDTDGFGDSGTLNTLNNASNNVFLQKRFLASVALNGIRNTLTFNIFDMSRKPLSSLDEDSDLLGGANAQFARKTKQTGANTTWTYRVSQRTNASARVSFVKFKFLSTNTSTNNWIYQANLNRQFQPNLTGVLLYRHIQRGSNQFGDISSNSITASLSMTF